MGFFSWNTSDSNKSIANTHSGKDVFKVHLITRCKQVFTEENYEGYGVFGGMDYYDLVAILNGLGNKPLKGEELRSKGIGLIFHSGIRHKKTGKEFIGGGNDFFNWEGDILDEGMGANDLVKKGIYERFTDTLQDRVEKGVILPKFVEKLPSDDNLEQIFDVLPQSTDCEFQGYFY